MKVRTMVFSQDWEKLNDRVFATIRMHRGDLKYVPDERVEVVSPKRRFQAHVLLACTTRLKEIPLTFLEYDLEAKPGEKREDLINKLGRLYKLSEKPSENDTVTIYMLQRL
ncbi:MAG: hypothetical protein ACUVT7_08025 [Thermoplasmata archaeon]